MLKDSSKKKRSRAEIEEVKQEEELLNNNRQEFLRQFKQMKSSDNTMGEMQRNIEKNERILNNLFTRGVIDEEGTIVSNKKAPTKMHD